MYTIRKALALSALALALFPALQAAAQPAQEEEALVSIKELMEKTITPATNTLWNAFEPPAEDGQWQALEEAAITLLAAAQAMKMGGTGPMDDEWVKEEAWQAYNQIMINAGRDALTAIRERNHDGLLAAGDVLYPPCEGCHLQFNPGVVNQQ